MVIQWSAVKILDFASDAATMITTAVGTGLTLYLGLQVERKRVRQEEAANRLAEIQLIHDALVAGGNMTINESRSHLPVYDVGSLYPTEFDYEDADIPEFKPVVIPHQLYNQPELYPKLPHNVIKFPTPSAHYIIEGDKIEPTGAMMDQSWENAAEEEAKTLEPEQEICKHCYRQIKGAVHAEGMNRGKMRCDPEDSLMKYGYNAEPTGSECGQTCLGHK